MKIQFNKHLCSTIVFFFLSFSAFSQEEHEEQKEPGWEVITSGIFIYTPKSGDVDVATEIHLTYWTTHKWAFGAGYSMVFEKEGEIGHELAGLVSYRPSKFLTVNVGPSFSMPNSHKDTEVSAYTEGEFAFDVGSIHMGPTVGALVGEEIRFFGGWHFSYEF